MFCKRMFASVENNTACEAETWVGSDTQDINRTRSSEAEVVNWWNCETGNMKEVRRRPIAYCAKLRSRVAGSVTGTREP